MPAIQLKSVIDIKAKIRDLLHRHRTRYVKNHLVPCPENCEFAIRIPGKPAMPCPRCQADPGHSCNLEHEFHSRYLRHELEQMFQERANDKEWLARETRDVYMLLWVLGQISPDQEPDPGPLPDHLMQDPPAQVTGPHPTITPKVPTPMVMVSDPVTGVITLTPVKR